MGTTKTFQNSTIVAGKVDTTVSATGYNTTTARTNTLTTVGIGEHEQEQKQIDMAC